MGKKDKKDKKNKAEPEDENKAWEVDVNAQRFIRTTTPVLLDVSSAAHLRLCPAAL